MEIEDLNVEELTEEQKFLARVHVSKKAIDLDDEYKILEMLGLL